MIVDIAIIACLISILEDHQSTFATQVKPATLESWSSAHAAYFESNGDRPFKLEESIPLATDVIIGIKR